MSGTTTAIGRQVRRYPRSKWPLLAVVIKAEAQTLMARADLAAHFRSTSGFYVVPVR